MGDKMPVRPPVFYADPPNPGDRFPPDYDPSRPTFGPPAGMPPPPFWNDTEYAWLPYPGQPCCPDEASECICITSADTSAWDYVYNIVSANSASWGGEYSSHYKYWDETYSAVSANSAKWESAYSQSLTAYSARWESAYNAVSACQQLIDTYSAQSELYSKSPVIGNGTEEKPFTLEEEITSKISDAYSLIHELIYQLYANDANKIAPALQEWLHKDSLDPVNHSINSLNMSAAMFENQVVKLWEAIKMLNGGKAFELVSYLYSPDMTVDTVSNYNMPGIIYYNED